MNAALYAMRPCLYIFCLNAMPKWASKWVKDGIDKM